MFRKMRLSPGAVLCVVLVLIGGCAGDRSWRTYIAAGGRAYEQGDYAQAEKQYLRALKKAENFGEQDPRLARTPDGLSAIKHAPASTRRLSRSASARWR